jgi:geranylgeranyl pyrophosphate synthase
MDEAAAARRLARHARSIEAALRRAVPARRGRLREAMRYSLLDGGKRIRPLLVLATGELGRRRASVLAPVACAVELVHTYSLVHDDLPAMDDDDLRRGRPSSHRVYGEGLAILVGDALLTEAFGLIARAPGLAAECRTRLVAELAEAAGEAGMVGGQALDLAAAGRRVTLREVRDIHRRKTGALLRASVRLGAIAGGVDARRLVRLTRYGERLGLAFQIVDDVLDEPTGPHGGGPDRALAKGTYPATLGLDGSRRAARRACAAALEAVGPLGAKAEPLRMLARLVLGRLPDA